MFEKASNQSQEHDLRFKQEQIPQERFQPDSPGCVGWCQRLKQRLAASLLPARHAADHPLALDPEPLVPDGHLALLIQDGRPDRWLQSGRHQLSFASAKVEIRLMVSDIHHNQKPRHPDCLELALSLPYERALLYVDGVLVGIERPGISPENPKQKDLGSGISEPLEMQTRPHPAAFVGENELIQECTFIWHLQDKAEDAQEAIPSQRRLLE